MEHSDLLSIKGRSGFYLIPKSELDCRVFGMVSTSPFVVIRDISQPHGQIKAFQRSCSQGTADSLDRMIKERVFAPDT